MELYYAASLLDFHSPKLAHLIDDDTLELLDTTPADEVAGPLLADIPRKYLIEADPGTYPVPTPAQLAIPAQTPTFDDRVRLYQQRGGH